MITGSKLAKSSYDLPTGRTLLAGRFAGKKASSVHLQLPPINVAGVGSIEEGKLYFSVVYSSIIYSSIYIGTNYGRMMVNSFLRSLICSTLLI